MKMFWIDKKKLSFFFYSILFKIRQFYLIQNLHKYYIVSVLLRLLKYAEGNSKVVIFLWKLPGFVKTFFKT